ncbi:plasmid pRiA4b ORF-3 family protein [Aurantimonas sp. C2-6-R+9]|uniref:plasmid pRiA4b ORF-3 family protein n=1 Tax=unclassified Aurantimonas TaxID=2638230 RepID=UPI003FA4CAF0
MVVTPNRICACWTKRPIYQMRNMHEVGFAENVVSHQGEQEKLWGDADGVPGKPAVGSSSWHRTGPDHAGRDDRSLGRKQLFDPAAEGSPDRHQSDDLAACAGAGDHDASRSARRLSGGDGLAEPEPYQFRIHAVHYGSWDLGGKTPDRTLGGFNLRHGDKFVYEYDMTDYWEHEVRIETWLEPQPRKRYPVCIGGKGACPPEECGGPRGYDERKAEALGFDAFEDIDTMVNLLDRIVLQKQPHLLDDDDIRWRLEDALERNRAREPFWKAQSQQSCHQPPFRVKRER